MFTIGSLAFASPWLLLALAALPAIWLLLRVTPPAPRMHRFPAIRLLFNLPQKEETPARTPWWLILLRLVLAALVILALAHPLLNPSGRIAGNGPILLVVDDGWAAARLWTTRQRAAIELTERAERDGRAMLLLTTAPQPGGEAPAVIGPQRPAEIRQRLQALTPKPWPTDREAARRALDRLELQGPAQAVYLSDGLGDRAFEPLAERLQRLGSLRLLTGSDGDLPLLVLPPENKPGDVELTLRRASAGEAGLTILRALASDGRLLAREPVRFEAGSAQASFRLRLPIELRNALARIELEAQEQTGAVVLLDDRFQRRPVGVIAANALDAGQNLLEDTYYLDRALGPFAEIRRGSVTDLLRSQLSVVLMADSAPVGDSDRRALDGFIEKGGLVVRFAGNRLAGGSDELLPVRLRRGGRELGTALQWTQPARLAPFDEASPFQGLAVPEEVTVSRQVLAEPAIDLAEKTWARLTDGTPLVTAARRGQGWLVLVHVPASTEWSNLPLSGLFVEMLRRMVSVSRGVAESGAGVPLPPVETLDGFGRMQAAPASAAALTPEMGPPRVDARHPPGFYGNELSRRALNLTAGITEVTPIASVPSGVSRGTLDAAGEVDLRPWLLSGALVIAMIDLLVALALRGLLASRVRQVAAIALLLAAGLLLPRQGHAADGLDPQDFALRSTLETRLAYVQTGQRDVDSVSQAGLKGLTNVLNRRTAVEAGDPIAVDVETDELAFFPLLYWPVVPAQRDLSPTALEKLNHYLRNGGTILFDTRDEGAVTIDPRGGPGARRLQQIVRGLEIPPLGPVPPEHVLTKAFYLMQEFPGRYAGAPLWVEMRDNATDEVSSVIVGSHDFAGAWAVDGNNRPMFAVTPGGEQQREMAFRFGVNLTMYALTGNYKTDQVHVPSILERLGQ